MPTEMDLVTVLGQMIVTSSKRFAEDERVATTVIHMETCEEYGFYTRED